MASVWFDRSQYLESDQVGEDDCERGVGQVFHRSIVAAPIQPAPSFSLLRFRRIPRNLWKARWQPTSDEEKLNRNYCWEKIKMHKRDPEI